jgi:DNA-binding MarR family transcriptional regulator
MSGATAPKRSRRRFDSPQQEAFLALWRTYDRLRAYEDDLFARFDLTPQQYNALRLLRAEAPDSLPTLVLAERLVSRAPDITRLLDKLEERGLITRTRPPENRRSVMVALAEPGFTLLDEVAAPLRACHAKQLGHLNITEIEKLIALLRLAREPHEPAGSVWR